MMKSWYKNHMTYTNKEDQYKIIVITFFLIFFTETKYKNALLDYKVCVCPAFLFQIPDFNAVYWSLYAEVYVLFSKWPVFTLKYLSGNVPVSAAPPVLCGGGGESLRKTRGGVDLNGWVYAGVREAILAQEIYCANPNPKPNSQSGSQIFKGLETQSL